MGWCRRDAYDGMAQEGGIGWAWPRREAWDASGEEGGIGCVCGEGRHGMRLARREAYDRSVEVTVAMDI